MSEETAGAAPSAVESPSLEIPRSGTAEYAEWRVSGELPEKPKPEDSATSDAGKEQATDDGGAEPPKQQEKRRKPDAEARIKQLTDDLKRARTELDEVKRPKQTQTDSSSRPQQQPQTYQEWRKTFAPSKWVEDYGKQNPQASYEDATAAMADYLGDVRDQFRNTEQQRNKQAEELNNKISDARKRYGAEFDKVLSPTVNQILGNNSLSPAVKAMLNDSEMLPDVVYTLGSDADGLKSFMQMPPGKQLRYIAAVESGIQAELSKARAERTETGQFAKPPAKRGPESAPEPPLEIGNRGGITLNESDRALQSIQKGDAKATRAWLHAENQKAFARRRGA